MLLILIVLIPLSSISTTEDDIITLDAAPKRVKFPDTYKSVVTILPKLPVVAVIVDPVPKLTVDGKPTVHVLSPCKFCVPPFTVTWFVVPLIVKLLSALTAEVVVVPADVNETWLNVGVAPVLICYCVSSIIKLSI